MRSQGTCADKWSRNQATCARGRLRPVISTSCWQLSLRTAGRRVTCGVDSDTIKVIDCYEWAQKIPPTAENVVSDCNYPDLPWGCQVPRRHTSTQVATTADSRLLDELREGFRIDSDKALAAWLGIEPSTLSVVRTGRHGFGQVQRLKVLDRIGFLRTRRLLESLLPDRLALEVVDWSRRNATAQARRALERLESTGENARLIEVAKIAFEFDTDDELAAFLGVSRNAISMVRRGRGGLGERPKLRILKRVAPDAGFDEIERALDSSDYMIRLVRRWRRSEGRPPP